MNKFNSILKIIGILVFVLLVVSFAASDVPRGTSSVANIGPPVEVQSGISSISIEPFTNTTISASALDAPRTDYVFLSAVDKAAEDVSHGPRIASVSMVTTLSDVLIASTDGHVPTVFEGVVSTYLTGFFAEAQALSPPAVNLTLDEAQPWLLGLSALAAASIVLYQNRAPIKSLTWNAHSYVVQKAYLAQRRLGFIQKPVLYLQL